jgi:hypothetical protein
MRRIHFFDAEDGGKSLAHNGPFAEAALRGAASAG